jgi:hypothetical protein
VLFSTFNIYYKGIKLNTLPETILVKDIELEPEKYTGMLVQCLKDQKDEPSTYQIKNDRLFKLSFKDEETDEVYLFPDNEELIIL